MGSSAVYRRSPGALWQRTSRRAVVNSPSTGTTLELDGVAAVVWDGLAEPVAAGELAADLASVFDRPQALIEADLGALLAWLVEQGAVECCE